MFDRVCIPGHPGAKWTAEYNIMVEEIVAGRPWRSLEDVEFATASWVEWFNDRRLFTPIGDIPPAEYEAMYYRDQQSHAEEA